MKGCDVGVKEWNALDAKQCGFPSTHALIDAEGFLVRHICRHHATEKSYTDAPRQMQELIRHIERNGWNEGVRGDVTLVSLHCETCKARLATDLYPGPKCPECMRAAMVVGATEKQTAAMLSLRKTIKRFKESNMATTQVPTAGLIDRVTTTANALGFNEMALRATARQIVKLVKAPLAAGLAARFRSGKSRGEFARTVTTFLGTDLGDAGLSVLLGGIVRVAPGVPEVYREALSRELIIGGGAVAVDFVVDIVMGPVREALSGAANLLADPGVSATMASGGGIRVGEVPATQGANV